MDANVPADPAKEERETRRSRVEALRWLLELTRYTLARNGADADDLVQETFLKAYLDHAYRDAGARGALRTRGDVDDAVEHGAVERVRPKMMTVTAIMAGLVPILWSQGTGADVKKRIAAPSGRDGLKHAADAGS